MRCAAGRRRLGAAINSPENVFDEDGNCLVPRVGQVLDLMAEEVMGFARAVAPRYHVPEGESNDEEP